MTKEIATGMREINSKLKPSYPLPYYLICAAISSTA